MPECEFWGLKYEWRTHKRECSRPKVVVTHPGHRLLVPE